jgi:hypothetical protein
MNKLMGELLESQSQLSKLNSELEQSRMSTKDLELRERKVLEEIHIFKETVTKTTKEYEKQEDKIKFLEANIESLTQDVAIKDRELHIIRAREESFVKRGRDLADKSTLSFLKANPTAPPEANQTSFIIDPNAASGGDQSGVGNQELSGLIDHYRSAVQTFSNTVNNELLKISDAKYGRNEQLRQLDTKIRARQNEMKELSAAKVPLATNLRQSPWQTAILAFLVVIAVLHYWQSSRAPL